MISFHVRIQEHMKEKVLAAANSAAFKNFGHGAASVRKTAQQSIDRAPLAGRRRRGVRRRTQPGRPGKPIHSRRGQARRAIVFDVNENGAIIGPRHSFIGESFAVHEFGEKFRGIDYPERPTMGLALDANLERFADGWADSIGE